MINFRQYITKKNLLILLIIIFAGLYIFRKEIKKSKYTQAKMEMMLRMSDTPLNEWGTEFKNIYDSLIVVPRDSVK